MSADTAIYVALATTLAVWATVALYLGQIDARLRALQQELDRLLPGEPPQAAPIDAQATSSATTST
jgi:hypothetical protein